MKSRFRPALGLLCLLATGASAGTEAGTGVLETRSAPSPALNRDISYQLYLPPGYRADGAVRYPVLYLLHGRGDKQAAWTIIKPDLDRLIAKGLIPPVIAVMPDAPSSKRAGYYVDSQFAGSADAKLPPGEAVETAFTRDLVAQVDGTFPTRTDRGGRIVAGYSMGGYGALRYSLAHPQLFGAAIVLSPAVYVPLPPPDSSTREFGAFGKGARVFDDETYAALNYPALFPSFAAKGLPLVVFIAVGDDEQALKDPAEIAHDLDYEAHTFYNRIRRVPGISAQLRVVDGGHNWETWRPAFLEGLQHVFAPSETRR